MLEWNQDPDRRLVVPLRQPKEGVLLAQLSHLELQMKLYIHGMKEVHVFKFRNMCVSVYVCVCVCVCVCVLGRGGGI